MVTATLIGIKCWIDDYYNGREGKKEGRVGEGVLREIDRSYK